jgi:CheY-like chemotaxis protein
MEIPYHPITEDNSSKAFHKSSSKSTFRNDRSELVETSLRSISSTNENNIDYDHVRTSKENVPLKILLVEDITSIAKMCSMVLRKDGHVVHHSLHGVDALSKLQLFSPFDVVIMDMQMPVMDGLEATRKIRKRELLTANRQIIIGCSANSDNETIKDAFAAGVDSFMSKPFTLNTFYEHLRNLRASHNV